MPVRLPDGLLLVRLLAVVGLPHALGDLHVREPGGEGRLLRGAGIDAERNLVSAGIHVADTHLAEVDAVAGALDAIVVIPAGEAVPHGLDVSRDGRSRPVGIAVVGGDAAQVLEFLVLIFDRALQPVVAVEVHHDTALVEPVMALGEVGLDHETEEFLPGLHLEDRSIVVAEMIVGPLPKVGMGSRCDNQRVAAHRARGRLACPLEVRQVDASTVGESRRHGVFKVILNRLGGIVATCDGDQAEAARKQMTERFHSCFKIADYKDNDSPEICRFQKSPYLCNPFGEIPGIQWKHSSAGSEHLPYKQGVTGSNPVVSTKANRQRTRPGGTQVPSGLFVEGRPENLFSKARLYKQTPEAQPPPGRFIATRLSSAPAASGIWMWTAAGRTNPDCECRIANFPNPTTKAPAMQTIIPQ